MRMTMIGVVAIAAVLTIQGDASGEVVVNAGGMFEDLLGLNVGERGVTFQIRGQGPGCTEKEHFHVERFGEDPVRLILIRDIPSAGTIPGVCRRAGGFRQTIRFSFRELGLGLGDRIEVINPVEINDVPTLPRS